jgi:hypothetical protein
MVRRLTTALLALTLCLTAPAAGWAGDDTSPAPDPYLRSDILVAVTLGFGVIHHTDHVLRANHSGWPFTRRVTPFTYSLAIYPIIGAGYFLDAGPLSWVVLDGVASIGLLLAHTIIEPPHDQHRPWSRGDNLLGVTSPVLGRLSQAFSVGLSLSLLAHLTSSIVDGVHCGFTWKRERCGPDAPESGEARIELLPGSAAGTGATLRVRF